MTDVSQSVVPGLRERQAAIKQAYRDQPETGMQLSAAYSVTEDGDDPTRVRIAVDGVTDAVIEATAHHAVGGLHDLPCSGDILMASLAACQEITLRMVAAAMGVTLNRLAIRVEGDWDARGTLGVDREVPVAFQAIRVNIEIDADIPEDRIARLIASAERYCVIGATLRNPPPVEYRWETTSAA